MKDVRGPERLLAGAEDPIDAALFAAANEDMPPADLESRILAGIAAPPAGGLGRKLWLKVGGGGLAVIAAGIVLWSVVESGRPPPATPSAVIAAAPSAVIEPPPAIPSSTATAPTPAVSEPVAPPHASIAPAPPSLRASAPPSAPSPSAAGSQGLAAEIAALDAARASMSAGNHARALTDLDNYDRSFPRGTLSQEATLLRIDVLMRAGRATEARTLGHSFLSAHPSTPHRKRIQTLLREGSE